MDYDPTLRALFFPGKSAPVPDFSAQWTRDQICAELCRRVYVRFEKNERARLEAELQGAGFGKPECFHCKWSGAQAFGTVGPDGTVYVVFRGTQITSPADPLADILAFPVRWQGAGRVHWGFWTAYRSIRKAIEAWLPEGPGRRLVITGHSLGAAMATLMAALHEDSVLVTFGSPRVGNRAFVGSFAADRAICRYVDTVDAVPGAVPPIVYRHLGGMIYIDHLGAQHSPPPDKTALKEDRRRARRIYRRKCLRLGNAPSRTLADHAPVNYISALLGRRTGP
jgi:pimeloyl-ACP methyl ester carboxylesterase